MTTFWRRQTAAAGNFPVNPAPSTGVPYYPQTLAPGMLVGRLPGSAGPTEAIPFALIAALLKATPVIQIITASGAQTVSIDTEVLIINKAIASVTPLSLPLGASRNKLPLEVYDWTGLAGDITFTPTAPDKIMGATNPWIVGSGGVAQAGGSLKLVYVSDILGWLVR